MKILEITEKYEKEILFTVFLLGIVAIFWTFLSSFGLGESGYNFLGKTKKLTLSPGSPVTQTFTAYENNLSQIRFVMGNVHIQDDDHLEFRLMDETCQNTLASEKFYRKPDEQGAYTIFAFPAIPNSQGKSYCFVATYLSDQNRKGEKPYLSAIDEPDPVFSGRILTDTNKGKIYASQTLFLRPVYTSGSLVSDLWQLIERLSQYKPAFLKGLTLQILLVTVVTGTLFLGIVIIRR